ncbi:ATP-binding cassette domain-containing protein [Arhodomonas sp. AD133]|uniref:ATP-binding cassette domain-containing protein n=1 Tax=Arhodomonas sp. AD133 TaxID=3415009 RepID=UPI003EB6B9E3
MLEIDDVAVERDGYVLRYTLSVAPGEVVALRGRSGIGKTTLLDTVAGFIQPVHGDIRWQGQSLLQHPPERRPVSQLFQDHNLFEHLTAWRNLQLGFTRPRPDRDLRDAARALDIADQLHKLPPMLSGGQRQRLALVRTLLRERPLVLLDEPFAELDPETRRQTLAWTHKTARDRGKTVLLVTHQDEDVSDMADREIRLGESGERPASRSC